MIFNDFDIWEQAFKDMKLNEAVSFISRGRLITEASQVEMFNKINALLNCDAIESAHKWLFSLDPTELTEAEATKVNNLWKLGCDRGMIECGEAKADEEANEDEVTVAVEPAPAAPAPAPIHTVPQSAYTILYSAMRNGEIKTGEAYSNSINPRSAKADVIGQLERAGYTNVKVLAIECGDPDECGNDCSNTYCKQADMTPVAPQVSEIPDYSIDNESVAGAIGGAIKGAVGGAAAGAIFDSDELTEDETKTEVKKAFDDANKEIGLDIPEPNEVKKMLDDNKDVIEKIKSKLKDNEAKKNFDKILTTVSDYADGKIKESDDIVEANKPSSGIKTTIRGLVKILLTVFKLVSLGVGLGGKLIVWITNLLAVGADKLNMQLKDSEDESLEEADDKKEDSDSEDSSSDDKESDSKEDDKTDDSSEDSEDKADDSEKDDKKEEVAEEPDEKLKDDADEKADKASDKEKEDEELDTSEKSALKDSYKKAFKAAMQKCKFIDKCFDDLTLDEKVRFFTELSKAWSKADPSKFMSDKELAQLQTIVIKK